MMKTISTLLYDLPEAVAARLAWLAPLLARVAVGWVFLMTGWGKLNALDQIVGFFRSLGIPYPELQAPFVATVELVCGAMILVGLFTRIAVVPLIGTMVVAIATAQWSNVSNLAGFLGLVETLYIVCFVWLAIAGPGAVSLDALIRPLLNGSAKSEGAAWPAAASSRARSPRSSVHG
ncbi:MAG: DoxX family protein [Candidatus Binatia bacterium]